jgi:fimbrial chaperone protein
MKNIERYTGKAAVCAAFLLTLIAFSHTATASIDISPVVVELSETRNKEVVRITNSGETAKSFEVSVVAWSQSGEDREIYAPTDELLAVPPLFTLQAGEQQVVRIGLMRPADAEQELSYRVFFTELEPPEIEQKTVSSINVRLRFGIPTFVAPLAIPVASIEFVGTKMVDEHLFMELRNSGNIRVKVNEVRYQSPTRADKDVTQTVFYLHPGKTGSLPLQLGGEPTGGKIELVTDTAGVLEYVLAGPE